MKLELKELIAKIINTPLVIEKGSSTLGNMHWAYRKWSDGTAECWGYGPTILANCTTGYGYSYYASAQTNQNFPSGLFKEVPRIIVTPISADGVYMGVSALTKDSFAYYPYCNKNGSHYVRWDCHAIGRWK